MNYESACSKTYFFSVMQWRGLFKWNWGCRPVVLKQNQAMVVLDWCCLSRSGMEWCGKSFAVLFLNYSWIYISFAAHRLPGKDRQSRCFSWGNWQWSWGTEGAVCETKVVNGWPSRSPNKKDLSFSSYPCSGAACRFDLRSQSTLTTAMHSLP